MATKGRVDKILLAIALLGATGACLKADTAAAERTVPVCITRTSKVPFLGQAQMISSGMFEAIGVTIEWRQDRRPPTCAVEPDQPILVTLHFRSDELERPKALAYARPYEGRHIVIFYDRVLKTAPPGMAALLLAHVLVHEITHILQGTCRHSASGVMKARWGPEDFDEMALKPLPFTQIDVVLIQQGLEGRYRRQAGPVSLLEPPR
jgi:hypothetical protein